MARHYSPDRLEAELTRELDPRVVANRLAAAAAEAAAMSPVASGSGHKPTGKVRTPFAMVKRRRRRQR